MRKLIRKGECNHCGICCGYGTTQPCPHHDPVAMRCMVYRIAQPEVCKRFPSHPKYFSLHLEPGVCGFRFYDSKTGQEIAKRKHKNADGNWECDWSELDQYPDLTEEC